MLEAGEHWHEWLKRYGADYETDDQRRAAYRDFKANLARLTEMFSRDDNSSL